MICLWLVVAGYLIFVVDKHEEGYRAASSGQAPLFTDFTPTYGASLLVRELPAQYLYHPHTIAEAGRAAARSQYGDLSETQVRGIGFSPWLYPPSFIPLIAPLAQFPYLLAYGLWLLMTAVPYLAAMGQILPWRVALPLALAAPPVFFNAMFGQTGFLTAGLLGLGLAGLKQYPILSGVFIGLASVKPHFGLLIPLALLAGGYWRSFAGATLAVLATVLLSLGLYGAEPWFAFLGTLGHSFQGLAGGAYNFRHMASPLAMMRMAGVPFGLAWSVQVLLILGLAVLMAWVWWRGRRLPETLGIQAALLCIATPLAMPAVYLYDLVILAPAVAWLWLDMQQRGASAWERPLLFGAMASILMVFPLAKHAGFQVAPLLLLILLALALHRFRQAFSAKGPQ